MQSKEIIAVLNNPEAVSFINDHLNSDISKLALSYSGKVDFNLTVCLQLLATYKKAKKKLPTFYNNFLAIDQRSYEQASSEEIAQFKTTFIQGESLVDLSGGIGVDSLKLSQVIKSIDVFERNEDLHQLAQFNLAKLGVANIQRIQGDATQHLTQNYDWAYIDPDRRVKTSKGVSLDDMDPDIRSLLPLLKKRVKQVYIKLSPLFDIDEVWRNFNCIEKVFILAEGNEVKEVGVLLDWQKNTRIIELVDVKSGYRKSVDLESDNPVNIDQGPIPDGACLFLPNVLVTKSRMERYVLKTNTLTKHPEFNFYFGQSKEIPGFRKFKIIWTDGMNLKWIKKQLADLKINQLNIVIKGKNEKPHEWHKKLRTRDGGDYYLFLLYGEKKESMLCLF